MFENGYLLKDVNNVHTKSLVDIKWNFEGNYLGTISYDKTVKISQLEGNGGSSGMKIVQTIPYNSTEVNIICWHPEDNLKFCLVGEDKAIELWDVRAPRASSKLTSVGGNINMSWSPNGRYICVGNKDDQLLVYDIVASKQLTKHKFAYEVNEFAWTAHSDHILTSTGGSEMGCVDVIAFQDQNSLVILDSIAAHNSNCYNLKIDPTFQHIAMGGVDNLVSLWDLNDMICHNGITMETDLKGFSFSSDGSHLAIVSEDPFIYICNSFSGQCVGKLNSRTKVSSLAWHPKRNVIAIGCDDRSSVPIYVKLVVFP